MIPLRYEVEVGSYAITDTTELLDEYGTDDTRDLLKLLKQVKLYSDGSLRFKVIIEEVEEE